MVTENNTFVVGWQVDVISYRNTLENKIMLLDHGKHRDKLEVPDDLKNII